MTDRQQGGRRDRSSNSRFSLQSPKGLYRLLSKTARPRVLFTLQRYLDNPPICLRRRVCRLAVIGWTHQSVRRWGEVNYLNGCSIPRCQSVMDQSENDSWQQQPRLTNFSVHDDRFGMTHLPQTLDSYLLTSYLAHSKPRRSQFISGRNKSLVHCSWHMSLNVWRRFNKEKKKACYLTFNVQWTAEVITMK